jgi:hypothetical protein
VETARAGLAEARAVRDGAAANYEPLAPDSVVWAMAIAVDLALALGLLGLALTRAAELRRKKRETENEAAMLAEEASKTVAEVIDFSRALRA